MDYDRNPYRDDPVAPQPHAVSRLTQAAIALLFAIMAIYLAS
jgi:hypothetical protein